MNSQSAERDYMPRLTSDEKQALRDWWEVGPGWDDQDDVLTRLQRVVVDIVAGRLAPIEAVCVQWDTEPSLPPAAYNLVDDVRAAMGTPPASPSASDANWWCRECVLWHPKDMGASPAEAHAEWERRVASPPATTTVAQRAAALYDETLGQVQASAIGSVERRLHSALGDLAHIVLSPGAPS